MNPHIRRLHNFPAIIPLDGQDLDINYPIHPGFLALSPTYTAIEKSIHECCLLDVSSIWIACPATIEPYLRKLVGNYACAISDTISHKMTSRHIPIFLVPTSIHDEEKRKSFVWSIISVAETINSMWATFSSWCAPKKFFVTFPYGVFDFSVELGLKEVVKTSPSFAFRHNGKTIADGEKLSFTFDAEYLKVLKKRFTEITISVRQKTGTRGFRGYLPKAPIAERWTGRWLGLKDMFYDIPIDAGNIYDVEWFYDVSAWDGYRKYLGSEHADLIKRPSYQRWGMLFNDNNIRTPRYEKDGEKIYRSNSK